MEINYQQTPFTRGIDKLDKRFGKPGVRELIVLFGMASAGKTEFSYFVARANADKGNKILYISLELPEYDMKLRICRKRAGISKYDFQTKNYTEKQKQIMEEEWKNLKEKTGLFIYCPDDKSIAGIHRAIMKGYDEGCRMFFIDNLDKITYDGTDENTRYQKITTLLQDYKNDNDACIILIHHAKKQDSKNSYRRAGLTGLRGNQKIIDNATQVFELFRDLDPDEVDEMMKAKVEMIQVKDTFEGANGVENIYFYKSYYYDEEGYRQKKYEA